MSHVVPHVKVAVCINGSVCVCLPLQYMGNVDSWCKACGEVDLPSELQDLEDAIHHHQGLYEHITAAYSEVTSQFIFRYNVQNHDAKLKMYLSIAKT